MSTAHDILWLARYAYNTINPLVQEDEKLQVVMTFGPGDLTEGVDIWLHKRADGKVVAYKSWAKTQQQVDDLGSTISKLREQSEAQRQTEKRVLYAAAYSN